MLPRKSYQVSMKPFRLLVMVVCLSSLFWSLGSTEDEVAIFLPGSFPQVFEGIPALLICVTNSSFSDRTWIKDGIEIARCLSHDMLEEISLPRGVSVSPNRDVKKMTLLCTLDFANLTISDHDGNYTCLGKTATGSSKAETYMFTIRERKPFCEPEQPRVEYLVDELAILSCHNPNYYNPNRTILWSHDKDGFLHLLWTPYEYTSRLDAFIQVKTQFNESVFSCHAFTEEQLETFTDNDKYSCSVGPVFVYSRPFLSIVEVENTVQSQREKTVVNCRLVPSKEEGEVRWRLPPSSLSYTISTVGVSSNITFSGIGTFQEDVVNVTCEGFYQGFNISSVYTLDLSISPNRGPDVPSGDKPDFLSPLNIVLSALGVLILIAIIVCVCLIIFKFQRSRENQIPTYSNDEPFSKNQIQMGNVKDAVELDSNLQRYHPEPFQSSQSQPQLIDQRQYDVPPFADLRGDAHGLNLSQGGYETDDRIYDPATTEPAEYYQMGDDMEEYVEISEVRVEN